MKKVIAFFLGVLVILALVGCSSERSEVDTSTDDLAGLEYPAPTWGDSLDGRNIYTSEDVEKGVLGDNVMLNSLIDSPVRDARWFVWCVDADSGKSRDFTQNALLVEDGKTYEIWLYVQNDNPKAISEGTRVAFGLSVESTDCACSVSGIVHSDNAVAAKAWSTVTLVGKQDFGLEYVYGSARLINEAYPDGLELGDEIVTKAASERGVAIGYDEMNGELPGGSEHGAYVTIRVTVRALKLALMDVNSRLCMDGTKDWLEEGLGTVGDEIDFRVEYRNAGEDVQENVTGTFTLDERLEYVPGSGRLYNGDAPTGICLDDDFIVRGVDIGNYAAGANALIDFRVRVKEEISEDSPAEIWSTFFCRGSSKRGCVLIAGPSQPEA